MPLIVSTLDIIPDVGYPTPNGCLSFASQIIQRLIWARKIVGKNIEDVQVRRTRYNCFLEIPSLRTSISLMHSGIAVTEEILKSHLQGVIRFNKDTDVPTECSICLEGEISFFTFCHTCRFKSCVPCFMTTLKHQRGAYRCPICRCDPLPAVAPDIVETSEDEKIMATKRLILQMTQYIYRKYGVHVQMPTMKKLLMKVKMNTINTAHMDSRVRRWRGRQNLWTLTSNSSILFRTSNEWYNL